MLQRKTIDEQNTSVNVYKKVKLTFCPTIHIFAIQAERIKLFKISG